jgi:hypothetical protein
MSKKYKEKTYSKTLENVHSDHRNPYKVIEALFSENSLEHYKKYISSMIKAAFSEGYWTKSDPGSLLHFQERMECLIRAVYLFVKNGEKKIKKKNQVILESSSVEKQIDTSSFCIPIDGNSIWELFPRYLAKEEFVNPYLVFKLFFEYKDVNEWLKEFKEIISYALSSFGSDAVLEFDFLEINRQLQKLIEASHLIHIRINGSDYLNANKHSPIVTSKDELEIDKDDNEEYEDYPSDPYQIINRFFLDGSIEDGREDIYRLLQAAYPDEIVTKKNYPSILIFIFERIDKLIDAAYTINQEVSDKEMIKEKEWEWFVIKQVKILYKKLKDWNHFPYKLKPFEWIYPRLVIKSFFIHQPLSHWKGKLHEILQASIRDESICYLISDRSKLYWDCEHLERLVEAMWVIKVMELS